MLFLLAVAESAVNVTHDNWQAGHMETQQFYIEGKLSKTLNLLLLLIPEFRQSYFTPIRDQC